MKNTSSTNDFSLYRDDTRSQMLDASPTPPPRRCPRLFADLTRVVQGERPRRDF